MARPLTERGGGGIGFPDREVGVPSSSAAASVAATFFTTFFTTFLTTFLTTGASAIGGAATSSAARFGGAALPLDEMIRLGPAVSGAGAGAGVSASGISASGVSTGGSRVSASGATSAAAAFLTAFLADFFAAFLAVFFAAFFAAFFAFSGSGGCSARTRPSRSALRRTRSACASTMLEEWLLTPIPSDSARSRVSLLVRPNSRASS